MKEYLNIINKYKNDLNLILSARTAILSVGLVMLVLHLYFLAWVLLGAYSDIVTLMGISLKVSMALLLLYFLMTAYKKSYSIASVCKLLDMQTDHRDDLYQNTLELGLRSANPDIIKALQAQSEDRLQTHTYNLPHVLPRYLVGLVVFFAVGILSVWMLNFAEFSKAAKQFYTNKAELIEYKQTIEVSPGNMKIGKQQQVIIRVINPDPHLEHRLFYRYESSWRELAMTNNIYSFDNLENSIDYYIQNSVTKSPVYRIEVLDLPFASKWSAHYSFPAYTGLAAENDTLGYGNLRAYKYSTVKLIIGTNIATRSASMNFGDGKLVKMQALDDKNWVAQFQIAKADTWYLELVDELGRKSIPEPKQISVIADRAPEIAIRYPGEDVMLNQNLLLPLVIYADDDFGLKNLSLHYKVNDSAVQQMMLQEIINAKLFQKDYIFSLRDVSLFPCDVVSYWAEVYDNSIDTQKAQSAVYKARFPSIEELYRALEQGEQEKQSELAKALQKSQELQKDFEQKRRELLKQDDLSWDDKKQLEEALKQQESLAEQVENIAESYQDLIDKMQVNQTLSQETLEKMMKIQELMQEIANDDLLKAMQQFDKALQDLSPEAIRKAMENFKFSMEDFSKKIEQTLDLLESIKKEQAAQKALQMADELQKMQQDLHDKSADTKRDNKALAAEQEKLRENYEKLKDELSKLSDMLDPSKDKAPKDMLDKLQEEMKKSDASKDMQSSSSKLEQNQRSAAQQSQKEALEKLRTFTKMLAEMKSSMAAGSQEGIMQALQTAIRELLIFSKKHEELSSRYNRDPYAIIGDLIAHYEGIQMALNKLYSSPQVMMYIPPKFFIDLTFTYQNYRELFVNISEMQYHSIPQVLSSIQSGINLMVYDLMQAMQNQSSGGGGGGGMQSLMQMLEQMGQEQMAMNMLTQQLMQQMQSQGGRTNPAMQQQMQKLANDTQRMADNLKRALQNNPEAQRQGNAIKQIIDEAEALSRQLRSNQLSPDIMNRQERILSRLLDAQRSLNKRDQTQKRKGETAEQRMFEKRNNPDNDPIRRAANLEESFRSFPKQYQEVILKYLKNLNEAGQQ